MKKAFWIFQILLSLYVIGLGIVDFIGFIDLSYRFAIDSVAVLTILAGILLLLGSVRALRGRSGKVVSILGWVLLVGLLIYFIKSFHL